MQKYNSYKLPCFRHGYLGVIDLIELYKKNKDIPLPKTLEKSSRIYQMGHYLPLTGRKEIQVLVILECSKIHGWEAIKSGSAEYIIIVMEDLST